MLVLSTNFWDVYSDESHSLLEITWKPTANNISETEFKAHLQSFVEAIHQHQVKRFLVDSKAGHFVMNVGIQAWHDAEIVPHYLQAQIQKIAFVVPEHNFVAAVSIEQTFDETQAQQLQTRYFDNLASARAWILS
ncbi:MAG: STAS/SEC14 domain-containing protein [Microscillaceae bacterium]|nr:STAS/SEC14 domain-containing protein [Microscillaceae bacterium]MDW8460587.1 STAS/SEC14 domain-containing protein [Cytophagales bacterium]